VSASAGNEQAGDSKLLNSPSTRSLLAGDLAAVFLPDHGMLCASLRHRGVEILGRVGNLDSAAGHGSTAGIPFLHPWANRLAGLSYSAAGKKVELDAGSPLLHFDARGLPMHGVPWALLSWEVIEVKQDVLVARLEWGRSELLALFPFRHRVEMRASVQADGLTVETTLIASAEGPVPISFGFHPYFALPKLARANWRVEIPAMQKLLGDSGGIPTGEGESYGGYSGVLGELAFDDGFALLEEQAAFSVAGAGRKIIVEFLEGYSYAQVYAPRDKDYIALEPMTAQTNALASGSGLKLLEPGGRHRAAFRVRVETNS
jgi:galactose mutarotase-like enzyme